VTEISKSYKKMTGLALTAEEVMAESEGKKGKVDHVNFYDPSLWEDLQVGRERGREGGMANVSTSFLSMSPHSFLLIHFLPPSFLPPLFPSLSPSLPPFPPSQKKGRGDVQQKKLEAFFRLLAVCHSVIPEKNEGTGAEGGREGEREGGRERHVLRNLYRCILEPPAISSHTLPPSLPPSLSPLPTHPGETKFSASSPDDEALVCAARFFGYAFEGRRDGSALVRNMQRDVIEGYRCVPPSLHPSLHSSLSPSVPPSVSPRFRVKQQPSTLNPPSLPPSLPPPVCWRSWSSRRRGKG